MPNLPLYILLCSGEHEKIQMAAMTASVAAVSERPVHVFISMNAMYVFKNGVSADERYQGGAFSQVLKEKNTPDAIMLFEQGRMLGEMTMHACSMAMDVLAWEESDLEEGLFDGAMGLTRFLSDAETGQLITL
jgi:peroxiredoxin family protein